VKAPAWKTRRSDASVRTAYQSYRLVDSSDTIVDFTNSALIGTSGININKLQRVQNCLARVVLQENYNSATSSYENSPLSSFYSFTKMQKTPLASSQ